MNVNPNWKSGVAPRVKLAFLAAVLGLLLSGLLTYWGIQRLVQAKLSVTHAHQVLGQIKEVRDSLHEIETKQRGYLITSHQSYLDDFSRLQVQVPRQIDELQHLLDADGVHETPLLRQQAAARVARLQQVLDLKMQGRTEEALQAASTGEGARLMLAATTTLGEMQRKQEDTLQKRDAQWNNGVQNALGGLLMTALINFALLTWLFMMIKGEVAARNLRENEHLQARTELEKKVAERTEELEAEMAVRNRNVQQLRAANEQMSLLKAMSDQLQACFTVEEAGNVISHFAARLFPGWSGRVSIMSESRNVLEPSVQWGDCPIGEEVFSPESCWALRKGRLHHVEPSSTNLACSHLDHPRGGHSICVPLNAQGDTLGTLHLQRGTHQEVTDAVLDFVTTVAEHVGLVLANLRLRQVLQAQSVRDGLTGLFNRRYMEESLEREVARAGRNGKAISVMMLDLDHFKQLNDSYGHDAGDAVLRNVGQILRKSVRTEDIACRYGGEEFTIIMPEAVEADAVKRAGSIIEKLKSTSMMHDSISLGPFSISIGISSCDDGSCESASLVRSADKALYQAKANGRGRVEIAAKPPRGAGPKSE